MLAVLVLEELELDVLLELLEDVLLVEFEDDELDDEDKSLDDPPHPARISAEMMAVTHSFCLEYAGVFIASPK